MQGEKKKLESNVCDPKQFWRNVKKFTAKKRQVGDISDEKWLQRVKKVFDVNSVEQGSDANTCSLHTLEIKWKSWTEDDLLNSDISPKEVTGHSPSQSEQSGWSRWHYSRGLQACW